MSVFDVPADSLIKAVATDLHKQGIEQPAWADFVKTGAHRERAPDSPEWFYQRMASILYRVYKQGPLGTESLRTYYGGKKRRGVKKPHFKKAGGKILRLCLQQLEKQGLVKKSKKGRVITGKGQSYLNKKAKEAIALAKQAQERKPIAEEKPKEKEKTEEEKRVEAELKKQEQAVKEREKAKEEAKKREKQKEEKKRAGEEEKAKA